MNIEGDELGKCLALSLLLLSSQSIKTAFRKNFVMNFGFLFIITIVRMSRGWQMARFGMHLA